MKAIASSLMVVAMLAGLAAAGPVSERWAAKGGTHPGTLKIEGGSKIPRLVFDLSALPKDAKVLKATLWCTAAGQPVKTPEIFPTDKLDADGNPTYGQKPLALEGPWHNSFDATQAVQKWVAQPETNLGLAVVTFEKLQARESCLDIVFDGQAKNAPEQVKGLRAIHHDGQTFIVWKEFAAYQPKENEIVWVDKWEEGGVETDDPATSKKLYKPKDVVVDGPGKSGWTTPVYPELARVPAIKLRTLRQIQGYELRERPSGRQGFYDLKRLREVPNVRYRVYRSSEKITPENIARAARIAEVSPLSGLETEMYAIHFQGEYINQREEGESLLPALCVADSQPILPGEGLYVHTADKDEKAYYAVTCVLDGTENLAGLTEANALVQPVEEKAAPPQPVLQLAQVDYYHKNVPEYWYRFWAAGPKLYNLPSQSFRICVSVPEKYAGNGPLEVGSIDDYFNLRGHNNLPPDKAVRILIEPHVGWMPNLFYNEARGTLRGLAECKVDYFSERYTAYLLNWVLSKHSVDRSRITSSMMFFGMRHPEIFAQMSFGTYTADYDRRWCPGVGILPSLLGPKGTKTVDGDDAWAMFSVEGYVSKYTDRDIPFMICISGVGKDSGHTSEFGWQDDPRGWHALLASRQTFVASWSCGLPRGLTEGLSKMRWDVSIPAFTNCSLDNNPGNGDPADGDYYGQINGYLLWEDANQVLEDGKWEVSVYLVSDCPENACTVDITPRHCPKFAAKPGQKFNWESVNLKNEQVQQGTAEADKWGLVTLKGVAVTKDRQRVKITRQ